MTPYGIYNENLEFLGVLVKGFNLNDAIRSRRRGHYILPHATPERSGWAERGHCILKLAQCTAKSDAGFEHTVTFIVAETRYQDNLRQDRDFIPADACRWQGGFLPRSAQPGG